MAVYSISSEDLASILGKTSSEIDASYSKEGEPLPANEIGKMLGADVTSKLTSVVDKEKQRLDADGVRKRTRRETFEEVEKYLKEKGAEGETWKDQLDHLAVPKAAGAKENSEADIKSSDVFKNAISSLKEKLEAEEAAHLATKNSYVQQENENLLRSFVQSHLDDPKNGYVFGDDQEAKARKIKHLMRDLQEGDHKLTVKDGKTVVIDKDGNVAQDSGFNDITPDAFLVNNAKLVFPKKAAEHKDPTNYVPPTDAAGAKIALPDVSTPEKLQAEIDRSNREGGDNSGPEYIKLLYDKSKATAVTATA